MFIPKVTGYIGSVYQVGHVDKLISIKQLKCPTDGYPKQVIFISAYICDYTMSQAFFHAKGFTVDIVHLDLSRCRIRQTDNGQ